MTLYASMQVPVPYVVTCVPVAGEWVSSVNLTANVMSGTPLPVTTPLPGIQSPARSAALSQRVVSPRSVDLGLIFYGAAQQLRGAGFVRPSYVAAANNAAGAGARRLLEADGLTVRLRELKP